MFDAVEYFRDNGIHTAPAGHKHTRPGWAQTPCLFCTGNPGYHLGFNLSGGFFNCWRCGWHSNTEIVKTISGVGWEKAKDIVKEYDQNTVSDFEPTKSRALSLQLPSGSGPLQPQHRQYLLNRGFDPEEVTKIWSLSATGPLGPYKYRIIAPIYYRNVLVSFQGRDFTDKSPLRYKACPIEQEVVHHKHLLYGFDLAQMHQCILVEGITDTWRLGANTVAGFGIEMKRQQILMLADRFSKIYIMFDDDPQAIIKAKQIGSDLSMMGVETEICIIKGDPGALHQSEADKIKRELLG